jgi:GNAT superfamily N-acetyltransferase
VTLAYSIRISNLQDVLEITALLKASYTSQLEGSYSPQVLARALPLMTKANPRLLGSGTYYVAETKTELVGCGGWSREAPGSGEITKGTAHIRHVATHPRWLRQGVGRSLLVRCFHEAASAGVSNLECHSTIIAVDFYVAIGFKVVAPLLIQLATDISIDGVLLRRTLSDVPAAKPQDSG